MQHKQLPTSYAVDSNENDRRQQAGRIVTRCTGSVEIHLGSAMRLNGQQPLHHQNPSPHQLQQQEDATCNGAFLRRPADTLDDGDSLHVQPTAPGLDTLQRPSPARVALSSLQTSADQGHAEVREEKESFELTRPPAFNPTAVPAYSALADASEPAGENSSATSAADGAYSTMPPPSYDEIYGKPFSSDHHYPQQQQQQVQEQEQEKEANSLTQTSSVSRTTTDECIANVSSLRCVAEIGKSRRDEQNPTPGCPGQLSHPTRISVRDDQPGQADDPAVMIVDPSQSSVHVFTSTGSCLTQMVVPHVNGGCIAGSPPLLLLAVGAGVAVYDLDATRVKEIPLVGRQQGAPVLTTVPYGELGFVAVRRHSLSICRGGITRPAVVHTLAGRKGRGPMTPFVKVVDVAVDSVRGHLIVLDAADPSSSSHHQSAVFVLTEAGAVLQSIRPARDPGGCGPLTRPRGVAVDQAGRVFVSDGGRLLEFCADDGRYTRTLIYAQTSPGGQLAGLKVKGIAVRTVGSEQFLHVVLTGEKFAKVSVFAL